MNLTQNGTAGYLNTMGGDEYLHTKFRISHTGNIMDVVVL